MSVTDGSFCSRLVAPKVDWKLFQVGKLFARVKADILNETSGEFTAVFHVPESNQTLITVLSQHETDIYSDDWVQ